jgi:hypothetical protein
MLKRIIPPYARLPLLTVLVFNFIAYYVPKALESHRTLHLLSTTLDDALPRIPVFIFIYVLAYVQWVLSYLIAARDSRERCFGFTASYVIGALLSMTVLLIYPTTMVRPPVEVTDLSTRVLAWIYSSDTPTNLFPSMHCLASWLCFRWSVGLRSMPRWYAWAQGIFTFLVFASVVLVKQHVWPDILGGVAAGELGILLSRLLHADRLVAKLDLSARSHA